MLMTGTQVRVNGEKFRVVKRYSYRAGSVVVQNVEGYRMTVTMSEIEVGW